MISKTLQSFVILCLATSLLFFKVDGFVLAHKPAPTAQQQIQSRVSSLLPSFSHYAHVNLPAYLSKEEQPVVDITSHVDWMELLHGHDDDRLTLVLFKAKFCKSCHRLEHDWRRNFVLPQATAATAGVGEPTDNSNSHPRRLLDLAMVEFTQNRALFKELNVQGLPSIHFYHQGRLLTGYSCPPKEFSRIMDSLSHYLNASPGELEFEAEMESKWLKLTHTKYDDGAEVVPSLVQAKRRSQIMLA